MNDIFAKDLNGEMVSPNDAGYEKADCRHLRHDENGDGDEHGLSHA